MCGICGQFNFGVSAPITAEGIATMMNRMVHRGPDEAGQYLADRIGLGFRRLSIIDLQGGQQPMSDEEASVWVVFNGEIYNFQELRDELRGYGHVFRTKSDTEVIVHGYKQWGVDVLQHLNGMFGVAVWDVRRRQLMLARDASGIKPLYFQLGLRTLAFSSEIRPLLACAGNSPEIDALAVSLFLRYRYTPAPLTLIKGIKKLAPGERLIVRENGEPVVDRWWNFAPKPFDPMPSDAEAEEELLRLYKQAVRRQLVSDVPVGLLLSGGLDSGLLLALMQQNGNSWNTYTVGYGSGFRYDELSEAAGTAEFLGAPNVQVEVGRDSFEATLPQILASLEEPIASSSVVPMYHVCKRAREDVKVALMGQGPDELFGGYTRHLGLRYAPYWRFLPGPVRKMMAAGLGRIPRCEWIKRGIYSLGEGGRLERYQKVLSIAPGGFIDDLFRRDVLPVGASDRVLDYWRELEPLMADIDELGGLQFLEIRSTLPDELLMYADKLSMAHGLEVRVPYLDQDVVKFTECLSASFKVRRGSRKWLHRRVCRRFLPAEVLGRKKKGFAVNVVDQWFRRSLSKGMDDILLDRESSIYEFLTPSVVAQMLTEHRNGQQDHHKLLFSLVVLEQSLRNYRSSNSGPKLEPLYTKSFGPVVQ